MWLVLVLSLEKEGTLGFDSHQFPYSHLAHYCRVENAITLADCQPPSGLSSPPSLLLTELPPSRPWSQRLLFWQEPEWEWVSITCSANGLFVAVTYSFLLNTRRGGGSHVKICSSSVKVGSTCWQNSVFDFIKFFSLYRPKKNKHVVQTRLFNNYFLWCEVRGAGNVWLHVSA